MPESEAGQESKSNEALATVLGKVLSQLSLTSWLPAGALIALGAFVVALGDQLDANGTASVFPGTFDELSRVSDSSRTLLIAALVFAAMITQAFASPAARLLEGRWGTNFVVEKLADSRASRFRSAHRRLIKRRDVLMQQLWGEARLLLAESPEWTGDMMAILESIIFGTPHALSLTPEQERIVDELNWVDFGRPDTVHRILNIDNRLDDFPIRNRIQPTRLGNVLQRYDDLFEGPQAASTYPTVVSNGLRGEFELSRDRLEIYCLLVFVWVVLTLFATVRFEHYWEYSFGAFLLGSAGALSTYRAAVIAARRLGTILSAISFADRQARSEAA